MVLICDVLEHVKDFKGTILAARKLASTVVIAVPDRPDRHAVRLPTVADVKAEFPDGWELTHLSTRHARHLMIFEDCR
jgi:hypothetical protein